MHICLPPCEWHFDRWFSLWTNVSFNSSRSDRGIILTLHSCRISMHYQRSAFQVQLSSFFFFFPPETMQRCLSGKLLNSILLKITDLLLSPAVAVMVETLWRHLSTATGITPVIPAASSHCALEKYCLRSKSFSLQIALRQIWHRREWNKCFTWCREKRTKWQWNGNNTQKWH